MRMKMRTKKGNIVGEKMTVTILLVIKMTVIILLMITMTVIMMVMVILIKIVIIPIGGGSMAGHSL